MTESSGSILRPLLHLEKSEILKYLDENKLEYKLDETNKDNTITRNKLRNVIIPEFYDINSNFKKNLEKTMDYFEELKDFLDTEVKKFLQDEKSFEIEKFNNLSSLLQKEVLRYIYYISN
jgi:tRNA(Ile)-lysidine synthase